MGNRPVLAWVADRVGAGDTSAARCRTLPEQPDPAPLVVRLFGPLEVRVHGRPVPSGYGGCSQKAWWVLALLALRPGREVSREWLAGTLWPESAPSQALYNLRENLSELRHALGEQADRLTAPTRKSLLLDLTGAFLDVAEFDREVTRRDPTALERAIALYRGPLLEGCAEEWVLQDRTAREQAYLQALETLAARALESREAGRAAGLLRRVIAADPLRESAHRSLMEALIEDGDPAAAMQVYRDLRLLLHRELNADPAPETVAFFEQIHAASRIHHGDTKTWRGHGETGKQGFRKPEHAERRTPGHSPTTRHSPGRGLPHPPTALIGRDEDVEAVRARLGAARLVTLTGAGGVGKTRMAIEVAHAVAERYAEGACFVDLAALADPELVPQAAARALGVRGDPGRPPLATLQGWLQDRSLLLVLDNCEHLVEACATLVDALVQTCPRVRILATSREPLRVPGEVVWRVPSLAVPPAGRGDPADGTLLQYAGVRLFCERAAQVQAEFRLTSESAPALAEICSRLDGIPLAIELAAARVAALSAQQIAARLDDRFHLLTGGSRTAPVRQQTLRAALDWSYDLLPVAEKAVLRRLSVFAGGWTLEAAEAVTTHRGQGGPPLTTHQILDQLTTLVARSLVVYEERDGKGRYRLLETVRHYAAERLLERGEAEAVRERHQAFFLALAEAGDAQIRGPEQAAWLARLEAEHDNLRAALDWCREKEARGDSLARLTTALGWFWVKRGYLGEARQRIETALRAQDSVQLDRRGKLLDAAATVAYFQGDFASSRSFCETRLAFSREAGDLWGAAWALFGLGLLAYGDQDYENANHCAEESLTAARATDDGWLTAHAILVLGLVARDQGDFEASAARLEEALALYRASGDSWETAMALLNLGALRQCQGLHVEAMALSREGLILCQESADKCGVAWHLEILAGASAALGSLERAARLLAIADSLLRSIGSSLPLQWRDMDERTAATCRAAMGQEAFASAWAEARAMTLDQAIAYALKEDDSGINLV